MPFARRNADGHIEAMYDAPQVGAEEEVSGDSPEVVEFLLGQGQADWISSDLALARVLEDLIDVLLERHVITFSDLPPAAQQKLITRRGLRKELDYVASLFPSGDEDEY
ncbi:hypothetical protein [Magnetospira sp. QH-2]|uniref:hypothetical protein n=1 Tax=Magnetospira sp. (strain QH-2) TaxID=1288970 RepID=UPI0003E81A02|nr:hypothetical protein [Magnetospira sp. QH-2]CCQ72736.1 conserved protein of unknown function [Magnetospira sp. QH-2]